MIHESASVINSNLCDTSRIYKGAYVCESDAGEYSSIGDDSCVVKSIIGRHCEVDRRNYIHHSVIGDYTYTGFNTYVGFAKIGRFSSISRFVDIGGFEHSVSCPSTYPKEKISGHDVNYDACDKINIGSDVWIGVGSYILRKDIISVGSGAVIAAGAVVTKNVPPYAVVGGVPAKIIRYRFSDEYIADLLEIEWWKWPEDVIVKNFSLLKNEMTKNVIDELKVISKSLV